MYTDVDVKRWGIRNNYAVFNETCPAVSSCTNFTQMASASV